MGTLTSSLLSKRILPSPSYSQRSVTDYLFILFTPPLDHCVSFGPCLLFFFGPSLRPTPTPFLQGLTVMVERWHSRRERRERFENVYQVIVLSVHHRLDTLLLLFRVQGRMTLDVSYRSHTVPVSDVWHEGGLEEGRREREGSTRSRTGREPESLCYSKGPSPDNGKGPGKTVGPEEKIQWKGFSEELGGLQFLGCGTVRGYSGRRQQQWWIVVDLKEIHTRQKT